MSTDDEIQKPLMQLMAAPPYDAFFSPPSDGEVGEYRFGEGRHRFRADACYEIAGGGRLAVEHDNSQTGLNNLMKYWWWYESGDVPTPLYLIHMMDDRRPRAIELCRFAGAKFEQACPSVHYLLLLISDWHTAEWQTGFRAALDTIMRENVAPEHAFSDNTGK